MVAGVLRRGRSGRAWSSGSGAAAACALRLPRQGGDVSRTRCTAVRRSVRDGRRERLRVATVLDGRLRVEDEISGRALVGPATPVGSATGARGVGAGEGGVELARRGRAGTPCVLRVKFLPVAGS